MPFRLGRHMQDDNDGDEVEERKRKMDGLDDAGESSVFDSLRLSGLLKIRIAQSEELKLQRDKNWGIMHGPGDLTEIKLSLPNEQAPTLQKIANRQQFVSALETLRKIDRKRTADDESIPIAEISKLKNASTAHLPKSHIRTSSSLRKPENTRTAQAVCELANELQIGEIFKKQIHHSHHHARLSNALDDAYYLFYLGCLMEGNSNVLKLEESSVVSSTPSMEKSPSAREHSFEKKTSFSYKVLVLLSFMVLLCVACTNIFLERIGRASSRRTVFSDLWNNWGTVPVSTIMTEQAFGSNDAIPWLPICRHRQAHGLNNLIVPEHPAHVDEEIPESDVLESQVERFDSQEGKKTIEKSKDTFWVHESHPRLSKTRESIDFHFAWENAAVIGRFLVARDQDRCVEFKFHAMCNVEMQSRDKGREEAYPEIVALVDSSYTSFIDRIQELLYTKLGVRRFLMRLWSSIRCIRSVSNLGVRQAQWKKELHETIDQFKHVLQMKMLVFRQQLLSHFASRKIRRDPYRLHAEFN